MTETFRPVFQSYNFIIYILFALQIPLLALYAQEADSLQVYHLDDIVVTATRTEKYSSDIGRSLTLISEQEIKQGAYLSPSEVLATKEGAFIIGSNQNPGAAQGLYMRGAGTNSSVILIDGIPISDPSAIDNSVNLSELSFLNIKQIEIIRGAHSVLYGSSAIGGAVNFISAKNSNVGFNTELLSRVGTFGDNTFDFSQGLMLNYTFLSGLYFNAEVFNSKVDGLDATVDTVKNPATYNKRDRDNFSKTDYIFKGGFINNYWDIYFSYRDVDQKSDIDKGAYVDDDNAFLDFKRSLLSYGLAYTFSENLSVDITGGYSQINRNVFDDSSIVDESGNFDQTYSEDFFKGSLANNEIQLKYQDQKVSGIIGLGLKSETMSSKNYLYSNSSWGVFESRSNLDSLNLKTDTKNIFMHLDINGALVSKGLSKINLALGSRLTNHSTFGSYLTYSFNPSVKITANSLLYASYATGYTAPSLYRLFSPQRNYISSITRGNKDLQPETSVSYEIGYKHNFSENGRFSVALFNTTISDVHEYIYLWDSSIQVSELGTDWQRDDYRGDTYINAGEIKNIGLEFGFNIKLIDNFSLSGNASWINGTQKFSTADINKNHTQNNHVQLFSSGLFIDKNYELNGLVRRANTANLSADYKPYKKLLLNIQMNYVDKKDDIFYNAASGPYGALDKKAVKSYSLYNLSMRYNLYEKLLTTLKVANIFDTDYREIYGYTTRGRSAYFGIRYSL